MKILYVATISDTINAFLIPHIEMLVSQGHQVDVACHVYQELDDKLEEMGCTVFDIPFDRSPIELKNFSAYKKLKEVISSQSYDIVHTHTPVASACVRLACRKMKNVKVIYTAHGFHFYEGAPLLNWMIYYPLERWLARYTDVMITINQEDYRSAQKFRLRREKSVYQIHGVGIDLRTYKPESNDRKSTLRDRYGYTEDDFILVYVAEQNYNKHQDLLIEVVNILKDRIPNVKLLLAGEGALTEKYIETAKSLNLEEHIHFLGYRNDVPDLLRLSDVAVSASRREGLPVNIMEAMATGLPIVATNCRGNRDLVSDHVNGFLVHLDDPDQFAQAIMKLYDSTSLRRDFGSRNIDLIQKYSIENVLSELKQMYMNL